MAKLEVVDGRNKDYPEIIFSKEVDGCKFPGFLKERASEWYSLEMKGKYIGTIYEHQGIWRAFNSSVENLDGKYHSCIKWLILNR